MTEFDLAARFLERSRYYLGVEYPTKIAAAVRTVPPDQLWWRPHDGANSAGNLVVHLAGNVRQWVVSGIGETADVRDRDAEFAATGGLNTEELLTRLQYAVADADAVIAALDPAALGAPRRIQGRETSVFAALYHVVEHFAGHTGQIILLAKQFTPRAVCFYDDTDGLATPLFLAGGAPDVA
ncbi:MAG: DUF664 domain-containing protein [Gemmatimonadota bacterium]|nr:DUF664 domain-containing protein [Gemmatimonadota bacterium]MDQ8167065.1 DUF664 domain-containing protein [Gemmatimonadota bacterium]MDQ8171799.1 DUF664 domain-containing protein [Gemmatimonadota bacterium]